VPECVVQFVRLVHLALGMWRRAYKLPLPTGVHIWFPVRLNLMTKIKSRLTWLPL
jgi:hypothetical protein